MTIKKFIVCCAGVWGVASLHAQQPPLRFGDDGRFVIAQFTDMHLDAHARPVEAAKTFARLDRVLAAEHPDLLVFTGDIVTGRPARPIWLRLMDTLRRRQVPFCVVLGNHDAEQDLTRAEIARIVTANSSSLNTLDAAGCLADCELTVCGRRTNAAALVLYCLDSHDYSTVEGVDGYGWFLPEQVAWLRRCCEARMQANKGKPVPSLAFFHIVLPEYLAAWRDPSNSRIGRAAEAECPGALNTGMFAAMVETGSVMGVFVGHDHDIDYVVAEKGVALGYGRFSGDNTTYNNLRPGVRLLRLTESERGFETWIREDDGRTVDGARFAERKITQNKRIP